MIKKLEIHNFKCIKNLSLECSALNLLIGTNSSGKSTIVQALLFVGQNVGVAAGLNGKFVKLGGFEENRCQYAGEKEIMVEVTNEKGSSTCGKLSRWQEGNGLRLEIDSEAVEELKELQYLSCHRVGPRNLYDKNMELGDQIGVDGQYAISYLNSHGIDPLEKEICRGSQDYTLLGQVNWWLKYITGAEISTEEIPETDTVKASYRMNDIARIRPTNIGAGISYLISILIVCLSSPKGSTLVIENPEIHLHPSAQSKICEFLYFIAEHGRQLFVESHSDHIFNGFRAGLVTKEMKEDLINIQFTYLNDTHITESIKVKVGKYGSIENQCEDLFDQFDLDLNRMLGL